MFSDYAAEAEFVRLLDPSCSIFLSIGFSTSVKTSSLGSQIFSITAFFSMSQFIEIFLGEVIGASFDRLSLKVVISKVREIISDFSASHLSETEAAMMLLSSGSDE